MTTRIGLVGAGFIGGRHVDSLTGIDGVAVTGIADPQRERAERLAERAGATVYDGWQQLLDGEELDALYLCVPPHVHGAPEDAAIDRGLPLFVEKPLATDLATAERLAARIDAAGLLAAAGYHWRYLDTVERARELLADRPARMVLGSWLDRAPNVPWWARQEQSGGQTVEQATHLFDLARHLVGEVEGGWATGSRSPDGERLVTSGDDPVEREDRDFLDAVRGAAPAARVPYAEALRTHALAYAADRSAREGVAVEPARLLAA